MGEEQNRYRKPRHHTDPVSPKIPTVIQSARSKHTISSLLSTDESPPTTRKKYFTSTRFRGLGCAAPAQVSVPAIIRASANWEGKKKQKKKKFNEVVMSPASSPSCLVVPDVWCGPDAASVDCVVSRRPVSGDKINSRERPSSGGRRMVHPEEARFFDSDSGMSHVFGSRNHRHVRHASPEGLAEIVMFQGDLVMGRLEQDRYREWRLDVDNMSYEELVELGDKIGYVSSGLREEEIGRYVRTSKAEMEWKCSICQEECSGEDEIGKVECGHFYHMPCINQWLLQKKTCPICKTSVLDA